MRNLSGVKAGDKVTVRWTGIERVTTVTEVSNLKIKTDDGTAWKHSGYRWGSAPYSGPWISLYEESDEAELVEVRANMRRKNLAYRLREVKWHEMTLEMLEAVHAIVFPQDGGGRG